MKIPIIDNSRSFPSLQSVSFGLSALVILSSTTVVADVPSESKGTSASESSKAIETRFAEKSESRVFDAERDRRTIQSEVPRNQIAEVMERAGRTTKPGGEFKSKGPRDHESLRPPRGNPEKAPTTGVAGPSSTTIPGGGDGPTGTSPIACKFNEYYDPDKKKCAKF